MHAGAMASGGLYHQHGSRGRQRPRANQVILVALITVTCFFFLSICFLFSRSSFSLHVHEDSARQLLHLTEEAVKEKEAFSTSRSLMQKKKVLIFLHEWNHTHKSEQELLEAFVAFSEASDQEGSELSSEKLAVITKLLGHNEGKDLSSALDKVKAGQRTEESVQSAKREQMENAETDSPVDPAVPDLVDAPDASEAPATGADLAPAAAPASAIETVEALEALSVILGSATESVGGGEEQEGGTGEQANSGEDVNARTIDYAMPPPEPPTLDFLATLLEQYRVEHLLWDQRKERENFEGSKYHLEVLQEKIGRYQALPEIEAYATAVREATVQGLRRQQSDCSRTLLCELNKLCGFGCQLHHAIHCFTNAVATRRALVLDVHPWSYSEHYETYFHPVSTCSHAEIPQERKNRRLFIRENEDHDHVFMGIIDREATGFEPPFLPPDVMALVRKFHSEPHVWWVGILSAYLLKLEDPSIITYPPSPYSALHVRRTDKVGTEADFHGLDEYMPYVKHKNVYLATDDPKVVQGAIDTYPDYTFYNNLAGAKVASVSSRYTDASLEGLLQDVFVLARADFLVGTFSSQISRLAYELAQMWQVDGIRKAHSIDSGWYFGGWIPFQQCLVEDYKGFLKGYAIQYDLNKCERTGFFKDKNTQEHFPFHLTETCSPYYANLLSDEKVMPPPPPPTLLPEVREVKEVDEDKKRRRQNRGRVLAGEKKTGYEKGVTVQGKKARVAVRKKGSGERVPLEVRPKGKGRARIHRKENRAGR